jgi:hypothetical protein
MQQTGGRAETGWLGIRIMCWWRDMSTQKTCFSELALQKSNNGIKLVGLVRSEFHHQLIEM